LWGEERRVDPRGSRRGQLGEGRRERIKGREERM
jgi:hypothetical protein